MLKVLHTTPQHIYKQVYVTHMHINFYYNLDYPATDEAPLSRSCFRRDAEPVAHAARTSSYASMTSTMDLSTVQYIHKELQTNVTDGGKRGHIMGIFIKKSVYLCI